ncbi:MAG: hypothetical protein HGB26_04050 [Desulfobulbaceae bacterium]|nr:hypothetical protein [Desulfobulbaceae bacterium]
MEENFWEQLKKPFFALAPMDDVTDFPFRTMLTRHGKPDVMWTEFVSADGCIEPGTEIPAADAGVSMGLTSVMMAGMVARSSFPTTQEFHS